MGTFLFIAGAVLVVLALLGLDWFMAGRTGKGRRSILRARDGQTGNAGVDYALIERESQSKQQQTWEI